MKRIPKSGRSHRCQSATSRALVGLAIAVTLLGCGSTTTRIASEQLLMSDAVDQAIGKIDFQILRGQKVFVDTLYLHSVKGVGFVNSEYIISSLRQQLTAAQCLIQDSRETADIVVEPRVGALGTDGHEVVYGIPQSGSVTSAAAMLSSSPIPAIPEISFGKSNAQSGIAKIIVFAYDRETREPVWQSGIAKAESTSSNTWYMGAGPFQKGSIYEGMRFAGKKLPPPHQLEKLAHKRLIQGSNSETDVDPNSRFSSRIDSDNVDYGNEHVFQRLYALTEPIPAATRPDEDSDPSTESPSATGVQQAKFEESPKKK